jgi:hypothetical protein
MLVIFFGIERLLSRSIVLQRLLNVALVEGVDTSAEDYAVICEVAESTRGPLLGLAGVERFENEPGARSGCVLADIIEVSPPPRASSAADNVV